MSGWAIELTPDDGTPLQMAGAVESDGIFVTGRRLSAPVLRSAVAQSPDGDGADVTQSGYDNRTYSLDLRVKGSDAASFRAKQAELMRAIEQTHQRRSGVIDETPPDGSDSWALDVVDAQLGDVATDVFAGTRQEFTVDFAVKPYGRLAQVTIDGVGEADDPLLVYDLDDIPGDSPALAQLSLVELDGQARRWLAYGGDAASTQLLFPAESLTLPAGSSLAATGGAHGAGSNSVVRTLSTTAAQSLDASGLPHVGLYRAITRAKVSSGTAYLQLRWALGGDYVYVIENDEASLASSDFRLLDLGLLQLDEPQIGDPSTRLSLWSRSASGTPTLTIDWLTLMPATHFYGELEATIALDSILPANGETIVRWDRAALNTSGDVWRKVNEGLRDPLLVHPGSSRIAVLTSRGARSLGEADGGIADELAAGLDVIPRKLYLPE